MILRFACRTSNWHPACSRGRRRCISLIVSATTPPPQRWMSTWSRQQQQQEVADVTVSTLDDPCTGCSVPCHNVHHATYTSPLAISNGDMTASVQRHVIHLLVYEPTLRDASQWPPRLEQINGSIIAAVTRTAESYKQIPIRVSSTVPSSRRNTIDVNDENMTTTMTTTTTSDSDAAYIIAFPLHQRFDGVTMDNVTDVVHRIVTMMNLIDTTITSPTSITSLLSSLLQPHDQATAAVATTTTSMMSSNSSKVIGTYFLICCHAQRDARCGVIGPVLVDQILKEAHQRGVSDQVHVLAISHIGGHKYAGNVIVYGDGSWYGRVTSCHVHVLLDAYINKDESAMMKLQMIKRGSISTA